MFELLFARVSCLVSVTMVQFRSECMSVQTTIGLAPIYIYTMLSDGACT